MSQVVSPEEWRDARANLLKEEKEATKLLSSLAAKRKAMPMVEIPDESSFIFYDTNNRPVSLLGLFEGRKQLIIYHHMPFSPDGVGCGGCSFFSDHIPQGQVLEHLHSRDTTFVATAPESPERIEAFKQRMGWTFPFYSAKDTFSKTSGDVTWKPDSGSFKLNCFLREGNAIYHTWETTSRGVEPVLSTYALLDMTKLGRQEETGVHFNYHDQY